MSSFMFSRELARLMAQSATISNPAYLCTSFKSFWYWSFGRVDSPKSTKASCTTCFWRSLASPTCRILVRLARRIFFALRMLAWEGTAIVSLDMELG